MDSKDVSRFETVTVQKIRAEVRLKRADSCHIQTPRRDTLRGRLAHLDQ